MLHKPWVNLDLIKPPKAQRLPDIVTIEEAQNLFRTTNTVSYRVFYFVIYSLGLRLGEGLRLEVGDIDDACCSNGYQETALVYKKRREQK